MNDQMNGAQVVDTEPLGQGEMFVEDTAQTTREELTGESHYERAFDVDLSLTLKPQNGKSYKISLLAGKYPGRSVEELLDLAMKSKRSKKIIEAVLDNPSEE